MIEVIFSNGEEIVKSSQHLYQWDTGQYISMSGLGTLDVHKVHFTVKEMKTAYVVDCEENNGTITAKIPNGILARGKDVLAYVTVIDTNAQKTIKTAIIPIIARNKPETYVDPGDVDIDVIERLENNIRLISNLLNLHELNNNNPHLVTKEQVGLGNVENKNSAAIRGEITKSNVTTALGYTPVGTLNPDVGSTTKGVYLSDGEVKAMAHTLNKDVPANAVFTDTTYDVATVNADGLLSKDDKAKLNGIATGAEVNQNAFSTVMVNATSGQPTQLNAGSKTSTFGLVAGSNVSLTADTDRRNIVINSTDTVHNGFSTIDINPNTQSYAQINANTPEENFVIKSSGELDIQVDAIKRQMLLSSTDEKVKQTELSGDSSHSLLMAESLGTDTKTEGTNKSQHLTFNPRYGNLSVAKVDGTKGLVTANLSGNADTATKATQDGNGNNIIDTYATKAELGNVDNAVACNGLNAPDVTLSSTGYLYRNQKVNIPSNSVFNVSFDFNGGALGSCYIILLDENKEEITNKSIELVNGKNKCVFENISTPVKYIDSWARGVGEYTNFQLELGSVAHDFVPYTGDIGILNYEVADLRSRQIKLYDNPTGAIEVTLSDNPSNYDYFNVFVTFDNKTGIITVPYPLVTNLSQGSF